jgi:hypothetical protein
MKTQVTLLRDLSDGRYSIQVMTTDINGGVISQSLHPLTQMEYHTLQSGRVEEYINGNYITKLTY